jgi:hypothetical protein
MAAVGFTPISLYYSTTPTQAPSAGNLVAGELALNTADGKLYFKNSSNVVTLLASSSGASGDVVGPASATDNAIVRFDGTTGKLVQNSVVTIADTTGDISGVGQLNATTVDTTNIEVTNIKAKDGTASTSIADSTGVVTISTQLNVDNLRLDGNTLSSTDSNGNIVLAPNGTGDVQVDADTLRVGDSNSSATITTNGTGDLVINTNAGTNAGSITLANGANGNITIAPNGTGDVYLDADTVRIGDSNANATLTTNGTGDLVLNTNSGTNSSAITIQDAANGNIIFAPNGTGKVQISGTSSNGATLEFYEDTDNGTNYVALKAADNIASNVTFTLPATDGTSGQAIVTNGSGTLSFGSAGISTGKSIAMAMIFGF